MNNSPSQSQPKKACPFFLLGKWKFCIYRENEMVGCVSSLILTQVNFTNYFLWKKIELDYLQDCFHVCMFHIWIHPLGRYISPEAPRLVLDHSLNSQTSPPCNNRLAEQILSWILSCNDPQFPKKWADSHNPRDLWSSQNTGSWLHTSQGCKSPSAWCR